MSAPNLEHTERSAIWPISPLPKRGGKGKICAGPNNVLCGHVSVRCRKKNMGWGILLYFSVEKIILGNFDSSLHGDKNKDCWMGRGSPRKKVVLTEVKVVAESEITAIALYALNTVVL